MLEKLKNKIRAAFCQDLIDENEELKKRLLRMQEELDQSQVSVPQVNSSLRFNLNKKNVYLIDFENIALIPEFVLQDANSVCYIFVGPTVIKRAEYLINELVFKGRHVMLPIKRSGKNQLDTSLSFILGQITAIYEPSSIALISNDSDYYNLRELMKKGTIPYKQMKYKDIKVLEEVNIDDEFLMRYMKQYLMVFSETECPRKMFISRLRSCKPIPLQIPEVQAMLNRLSDLGLIEERYVNNKSRIKIMKDKIKSLNSTQGFHA